VCLPYYRAHRSAPLQPARGRRRAADRRATRSGWRPCPRTTAPCHRDSSRRGILGQARSVRVREAAVRKPGEARHVWLKAKRRGRNLAKIRPVGSHDEEIEGSTACLGLKRDKTAVWGPGRIASLAGRARQIPARPSIAHRYNLGLSITGRDKDHLSAIRRPCGGSMRARVGCQAALRRAICIHDVDLAVVSVAVDKRNPSTVR